MKKEEVKNVDALNADIAYYNKRLEELKAQSPTYNVKEKDKTLETKPADMSKVSGIFGFWHRFQLNRKRNKAILVNMQLKTGDHRHFVAYYEDLEWHWKTKTYIVDDSLKYYDLDSGLNCLDYHEDFALPVKRNIDVMKIRKAIMIPGITDVDMAINPTTLKYYVESQFVQKIQRGADLDKIFQLLVRLTVITLIMVAITLILIINASGILKNIKIPGFG